MRSIALLISISLLVACGTTKKTTKTIESTDVDKTSFSYNYGLLIATSLKMEGVNLDSMSKEELWAGVQQAKKAEVAKELDKAQAIVMAKITAAKEGQASAALEGNKTWLAANGKKKGVVTTASGLQYEIIKEGTGAKPTLQNQVKTHYHGTLIDGTVFDSSVERGEPISFPLGGVIKGWQEGLQLMPIGSKWRFFIPAELGYGNRATGSIPANSILIFEVELLDIVE
ncbi:MAG: FKBP-type peptidyl-prolyl cis-trans isomerase [Aureispira sp.]|nr:FKBP-type peptidyl-prolyl cis-trans isomerase [Aureispira sp.]